MEYSFIAYILLAIFLELTVSTSLVGQGRTTAAVLVIFGFLLIFVFYGQRWFTGITVAKGSGACSTTKLSGANLKLSYTGPWPPVINMCPDYLVYFKRGTVDTCVDISGVNRSGGVLKAWSIEDTAENPPADDAKYFPYVYRPTMKDAQKTELCKQTMSMGLTWEGLTDGEKCTFVFTDELTPEGAPTTTGTSNLTPTGTPSTGAAMPSTMAPPPAVAPPPARPPPPPPGPVPIAATGASSAASTGVIDWTKPPETQADFDKYVAAMSITKEQAQKIQQFKRPNDAFPYLKEILPNIPFETSPGAQNMIGLVVAKALGQQIR